MSPSANRVRAPNFQHEPHAVGFPASGRASYNPRTKKMETEKCQRIGYVALVVRDYDEAIAYYTNALGFKLVEDTPLGPDKRWVLLAPPGSHESRLLIAKASTPGQISRVGNQTGGRVFLFLHTDDFWRDHRAMSSRGVKFCEAPREEPYGTVAVFEDLYGNRWDLLQLRH
jgi:catechol 2,3-dioxygenase-like lactoylglutathione lyase family enzyme